MCILWYSLFIYIYIYVCVCKCYRLSLSHLFVGFCWTEPTLNGILCIMGWTRIPPHSHRCLPPSSPARIPHTPAQIPLPPPPPHQTSHKSCSISKPVAGGISSLGRHRQTTPTILSTGLHGDPAVASSSALSARFRCREAPPPLPNHVSLHPHLVSPLVPNSFWVWRLFSVLRWHFLSSLSCKVYFKMWF